MPDLLSEDIWQHQLCYQASRTIPYRSTLTCIPLKYIEYKYLLLLYMVPT